MTFTNGLFIYVHITKQVVNILSRTENFCHVILELFPFIMIIKYPYSIQL